jgi:nitrous oxide reductase
MPDFDDVSRLRPRVEPEPSVLSRRSVLRGAAGAGAAGIAATAFMGSAVPAAASTKATAAPARGTETAREQQSGDVVVHVRDTATGEMDVFRGTTQTRVHDRELAARLASAIG